MALLVLSTLRTGMVAHRPPEGKVIAMRDLPLCRERDLVRRDDRRSSPAMCHTPRRWHSAPVLPDRASKILKIKNIDPAKPGLLCMGLFSAFPLVRARIVSGPIDPVMTSGPAFAVMAGLDLV
ncbi:hypothetical protein KUL72_03545 [Bradyrhizobium arachidis]|uniref:hypothetical protein n=1 Tax=Bradyrhizobium TaxID=374 RepID=UPI00216382EE|nr:MULTISPECIES: hypothetical protein [Bradyrhizobium]MDN4987251.1 hypothetical protein [Bradyrhizobium sp. WYCCWR 13022]UVO37483.1 hypothetical protein KUL72_03545 [Bradyrhizobium arachidis]